MVSRTQGVSVLVASGFGTSVLAHIWRVISRFVFLLAHGRSVTQCANSSGLMEKVGGKV